MFSAPEKLIMRKNKFCGIKMPLVQNGKSRGFCTKLYGHTHMCGNKICPRCGILKTKEDGRAFKINGVMCLNCHRNYEQNHYGTTPRNIKIPGKRYTFNKCGCSGVLPNKLNQSNLFVVKNVMSLWLCRVSRILAVSKNFSTEQGYAPIDQKISHSIIREAMFKPCVLCGKSLIWKFNKKAHRNPSAHHDHNTGEFLGFAHTYECNIKDLRGVNRRLLEENMRLKKGLQ